MIPFVDNLMPFRYQHLQWTLKGLEMTGVPLIEYDGTKYLPAGISDDTGIYYFIPQIAKLLNVNLDWAIFIFFTFSFLLPIITVLFIVSKLCKKNIYKYYSFFNILVISCYLFIRGDIYIFSALIPLFILPLLFYLHIKENNIKKLYFIYFFIGIIFSFSNFIRNHSATSVLVFITIFLIFQYKSIKNKIYFIMLFLLVGIFISNLIINSFKENRDNFLFYNNNPNLYVEGHVFWHTIYLGLGFLNNIYGIKYDDNIAYYLAKQKNPNIDLHSKEYENIMKSEVINTVKKDPWFILKTLFAKFGVILIYIIIFINIGFYFIIKKLFKNIFIFIPLLGGLVFNMIFPLIAMPFPSYLSGFIAYLILLNIFSLFDYSYLKKYNY
jgi:MFS family permease